MISREDFKKLAAGHFALLNLGDRESLSKQVEGALYAYDFITKNISLIKNDQRQQLNGDKPPWLAPSS